MKNDLLQFELIHENQVWENLVLSAENYSFLNSYEFGELQKELGNKVFRYLIKHKNQNVFAFQAILINAKRGKILHLRHCPLLLQGFLQLKDLKKQIFLFQKLIDFIKQFGKKQNVDFIRMQPLIELQSSSFDVVEQIIKNNSLKFANIHNIDAEKTMILDLKIEKEELLQNMRKQTRYYIRRAKRDGIEVEILQKKEAIDIFFKIHEDTVKRQEFSSYSLNYYKLFFEKINMYEDLSSSCKVFLAKFQNKYIAAAIIVFFGKKAFYSDGGSLTKYSKFPASYRIQCKAINEAKRMNCTTYNFWGGVSPEKDNKNYPWYGIDLFKRGFGGERIEYMHAFDIPISYKYNLTRIWEYLERKRRGY